MNNAAASGSSGIHQKFAAAQEITLILFLLFRLQAGNAFDRFMVGCRQFQAFHEPFDPLFPRLAIQSMTGFIKPNLLRLGEAVEIAARHFFRNAFVVLAELQEDRGRRAVTNEANWIVKSELLKEIAERFFADALAELDALRPSRIENVFLICEHAGHEHEAADSFFDAGENAAGVRIVTVANERNPRWVEHATRE